MSRYDLIDPIECDSSCSTCQQEATRCTACDPLSHVPYLNGTQCLTACPSSSYLQNSLCLPCDSSCKECNGSLASNCTVCEANSIYSDSTCSPCPSGSYNQDGTCTHCDESCPTCLNSSTFCMSCDTTGSNPLLNRIDNTCVDACPVGTLFDGDSTCQSKFLSSSACDPTCSECSDSVTNCSACDAQGDNPIFYEEQGQCVSECPSGSYNPTPTTCSSCHNSCSQCDGPTLIECTACPSNFELIGGSCQQCAPNEYSVSSTCQTCPTECSQCTSSTFCTACSSSLNYLYVTSTGSCVLDTCPDGTYKPTSSDTCEDCAQGCLKCSNGETCSLCDPLSPANKLFPLDSTCVSQCSVGYWNDNNTCQGNSKITSVCDDNCLTCEGSSSTCTSCDDQSSVPLLDLTTNSCVSTCPTASFIVQDKCFGCCEPCDTCLSPTNCTSCDPLSLNPIYQSSLNSCVDYCPSGQYRDGIECLWCTQACETCNGGTASDCLLCAQGYGLLSSECVQPCPSITTLVDRVCQACESQKYIYNGVCLECPLSPPSDTAQLNVALLSCSFSGLSFEQSQNLATNLYSQLTNASPIDSRSLDESQSLITTTLNTLISFTSPYTSQSNEVALTKVSTSSTQLLLDQGVGSSPVQVSLEVGGSTQTIDGDLIAASFRQPLISQESSPSIPQVSLDLEVGNSIDSTSDVSASLNFLFSTPPADPLLCVYWDSSQKEWLTTGLETQLINENEFKCSTSHFSIFTLIPHPDGLKFSQHSSETALLHYLVAAILGCLLLAGALTDCVRLKKGSDFFPHHRQFRPISFCSIFKYSLLYNFPVVSVWGFMSSRLLSSTKALWIGSMIWLIMVFHLIVFKHDLIDPFNSASVFFISLVLSLLLIPHSILIYSVQKNKKEKKQESNAYLQQIEMYTPPSKSQVSRTMNTTSQLEESVQRDIIGKTQDASASAQEKDPPHPKPNKHSQRVCTRPNCSVRFILLYCFCWLCWIVGISLSLLWVNDINQENNSKYDNLVIGFTTSVGLGLGLSLIKVLLASAGAIKAEGRRCYKIFFVDSFTQMIADDLGGKKRDVKFHQRGLPAKQSA